MKMLTTEQKIQQYVTQATGGKIKLPVHVASAIIGLVLGTDGCRAVLHRYSGVNTSWEVVRSFNTDEETMLAALLKAITHKPVMDCYRYDLYNDRNEFQGYIYSINPALF